MRISSRRRHAPARASSSASRSLVLRRRGDRGRARDCRAGHAVALRPARRTHFWLARRGGAARVASGGRRRRGVRSPTRESFRSRVLLPRLDYVRAPSRPDRTAVVVPLLLGSVEAVAGAISHLEVQYLANRDPQIRFALLSDLLDSPTQQATGDEAIVEAAVVGIRALNAAYGNRDGDGGGGGSTPPPPLPAASAAPMERG